ncbi:EamA family transporter [Alteromonas sp. 345S023]|uniref:EamA family transporter n=1 Tax=Alteromonas profundi TaxID=2696062 RepID=A0A7X5LP41_9ALTE|nr:DMT family transporter [Alteromonas profundi]NDV92916.1 EamA family transporter [Alteromonas profundi]
MGNAWVMVCVSMLAFAANSLFCRMALAHTSIDPGVFTAIRLISGAFCLGLLVMITQRRARPMTIQTEASDGGAPLPTASALASMYHHGNLLGALALFIYAIGFSYAYVSMTTGAGALLLFGAVQLTMLIVAMLKGERFSLLQWLGFLFAFSGLVVLLLPSASAPKFISACLMIVAGIAWGVYSLLGKKANRPLLLTAGNFAFASLMVVPFVVWLWLEAKVDLDTQGAFYALASGILASGCGYAIWYKALPLIQSTTAATVQLSVPVIATAMGWLFLAEPISGQMMVASLMTLGGIWLVIVKR